ncbi:hypothetical protein LINGRAHAP2_LOCUS29136 [Linum grandiflorum]
MNWKSWFGARSSTPNPTHHQSTEGDIFGLTQQLIDRVKSFNLDTFKNFSLHDDRNAEATFGDETEEAEAANIHRDLSEWQERHATLALSKVKVLIHFLVDFSFCFCEFSELSQLRFKLCPRHLKERDFWRIYFTLVKTDIVEYELRAIQLARVQKMAKETRKSSQAIPVEVEMAETVKSTNLQLSTPKG